jgi:hypothetical protein
MPGLFKASVDAVSAKEIARPNFDLAPKDPDEEILEAGHAWLLRIGETTAAKMIEAKAK